MTESGVMCATSATTSPKLSVADRSPKDSLYESSTWMARSLDKLVHKSGDAKYAPISPEDTDNDMSIEMPDAAATTSNASQESARVDIVQENKEKKRKTKAIEWRNRALAWGSMVLALFAAAAIGPMFKYLTMNGIRPCLSASWRCQCMTIILAPMAWAEVRFNPQNKVDWLSHKPDLKYTVLTHTIISGLGWSGNLLAWIVALQYTTTFKAALITCSHPILFVIYLRLQGKPVSGMEVAGVLVAFMGLFLSNLQGLLSPPPPMPGEVVVSEKFQLLGLALCFFSACCEVGVLSNRIATKKYVPLLQYTFATTAVVAVGATIASYLLEGKGLIPSGEARSYGSSIEVFCTEEHCIFGWFSAKWFWMIMFFGIWVGVIVVAGFNYAMQHVPPLVFSAIHLIDPALAAVLSWLCGVDRLPSIYSWFGGLVVMGGVGIIIKGEKSRDHQAKQHKRRNSDHMAAEGEEDESNDPDAGESEPLVRSMEMVSTTLNVEAPLGEDMDGLAGSSNNEHDHSHYSC